MISGIAGEILAAPQEALVFYTANLKRTHPGIITSEHIALVRKIIQEKIYYEPIIEELGSQIPIDLYAAYIDEYSPKKRKYAFTDDTTLSIAIMDAILQITKEHDRTVPEKTFRGIVKNSLLRWGNKYLEVGYGKHFKRFLGDPDSYAGFSNGNGSAMRTAAIGYTCNSASYLLMAREASMVSHAHPEAIRGALAVTDAVAQSLQPNASLQSVREYLERNYFYDLGQTLESIRPSYKFYSDAQNSVPQAIIAFLESTDSKSAVVNAISLGGDTDTQAMIAGSIADAFYGYSDLPLDFIHLVDKSLPGEMLHILYKFVELYVPDRSIMVPMR